MKRSFTKMQGLGNDFILFDELGAVCEDNSLELTPELARFLCDRRFGIGADGVFVLRNAVDATKADIMWDFYNSDGSVAEMCGNAIRCVARYLYDRELWPMPEPRLKPAVVIGEDGDLDLDYADAADQQVCCGQLRVQTLAGIKTIGVEHDEDGQFVGARVDMGLAQVEADITVEGRSWTRVDMGNPHAVTFVDQLDFEMGTAPVSSEGPVVEVDPAFPHKTNVEYVQTISRDKVRMRVWERGAGETLACGTGACATAVAARLKGLVEDRVVVELLGGELTIEVDPVSLRVFMTGPATEVYTGTITLQ
ncbi:MAG: diaminopimelate epimerase [Coriobacteriia bacterium]|nr:diaminopimelate epimerase [Coriobacteriia bacterium]MCL2536891.1 diaminopimelate epimerase [Coriobacteriia bacterium]